MKDIRIGRVKAGSQMIGVTINEYKNSRFVDVRKYYQDKEGEYKPTQKGISISVKESDKGYDVEQLDAVIRLLRKAKRRLEE